MPKIKYKIGCSLMGLMLITSCHTDKKRAENVVLSFYKTATESGKATDNFYPSYKDLGIKLPKDSMVLTDVVQNKDSFVVSATVYKKDSVCDVPINVEYRVKKCSDGAFIITASNGLVWTSLTKSKVLLAQKSGACDDLLHDEQIKARLPIVEQLFASIADGIKQKINYRYNSASQSLYVIHVDIDIENKNDINLNGLKAKVTTNGLEYQNLQPQTFNVDVASGKTAKIHYIYKEREEEYEYCFRGCTVDFIISNEIIDNYIRNHHFSGYEYGIFNKKIKKNKAEN